MPPSRALSLRRSAGCWRDEGGHGPACSLRARWPRRHVLRTAVLPTVRLGAGRFRAVTASVRKTGVAASPIRQPTGKRQSSFGAHFGLLHFRTMKRSGSFWKRLAAHWCAAGCDGKPRAQRHIIRSGQPHLSRAGSPEASAGRRARREAWPWHRQMPAKGISSTPAAGSFLAAARPVGVAQFFDIMRRRPDSPAIPGSRAA